MEFVSILAVGWGLFAFAVVINNRCHAIRDGLFVENILPGYFWFVVAFGYALIAARLTKSWPTRLGLLMLGTFCTLEIARHRLFWL